MSEGSALGKVISRVFPRMPNFFLLLNDQCDLAVKSAEALVQFMNTGAESDALRVREIEHEADTVKDRNMDVLNKAFATPMDREELYRAISSIDHIINYAKTTVREMEVLGVAPDAVTQDFADRLQEGALALQQGYRLLETDPGAAEASAAAARKAERNCEKTYRKALAELFNVEADVERLEASGGPTGGKALAQVMDVMKKREVYRHLSNAGDRVARAGEVLHDIVVKLV
ncbi:MAG: DUF47 family protein [Kineosporiaceae bacterium]|nr:DUF47 family protein [Kineosporiaceae bacterium]MBK8075995.1 DUF47 family protein [Kineosporiaceae bacterium]